jgi:hypothetical protein
MLISFQFDFCVLVFKVSSLFFTLSFQVLDLSFNDFKGPGFEPLDNCKALQVSHAFFFPLASMKNEKHLLHARLTIIPICF